MARLELVEGDVVPVAGQLFGGVGVEDAARAFDGFGDGDGVGALRRALEHHVLEEVRDAHVALVLAAGACADEDVDADGLGGGDGGGDDAHAVGQGADFPGDWHV